MKARLVCERNGKITIDEIVEVNETDKSYMVGRIRFPKGRETPLLLGVTLGSAAKSVNRLYREKQQ